MDESLEGELTHDAGMVDAVLCRARGPIPISKFILVIVLRQLVTLRLHNRAVSRLVSRLASLGSLLETGLLGLRNANGLQQNELSRPSLPRLPVARPTTDSQANPRLRG